jgi:3-deoxy-D-arabino-heptulosonate 7-phosphate (DAHP) synthase
LYLPTSNQAQSTKDEMEQEYCQQLKPKREKFNKGVNIQLRFRTEKPSDEFGQYG